MKNLLKLLFSFSLIIWFVACQQESTLPIINDSPVLPETPHDYKTAVEESTAMIMPEVLNGGGLNGLDLILSDCINCGISPTINSNINFDNDIATLGRVLFYDKALSKNNSISCASCHKQELAFADDLALSHGFGGELTLRNSMTIANPILNSSFFWDGRETFLDDLVLRPILDHIEMGIEDFSELEAKVRQEEYYSDLFVKAYGSSVVSRERIADALTQFVGAIFKSDSKFDKALTNNFSEYSELEKHGMALFFSQKTQCASCHSGANFAAPTGFNNPYQETAGTANVGLNTVYEDNGFGDGKFKIPSLRNIALTAPYMHDGRFETIREVIEHYNSGIKPHQDLDAKFVVGGNPIKMGLTDLDMEAIEAFLLTLTSETITTDQKFSNPF